MKRVTWDKSFQLPDGGYQCRLCGVTRCKQFGMYEHMRDAHLDTKYRFLCPVCRNTYKNRNSLRSHLFIAHKSEPEAKDVDLASCRVLREDYE